MPGRRTLRRARALHHRLAHNLSIIINRESPGQIQRRVTRNQKQVTAASREKVLDALGTAASRLRGQLGESLGSVQKFDVLLAEATTVSLDALKAFSLGQKTYREKGFGAALLYDQHAIELDPNFAMGYRAVGLDYTSLGEAERAGEYFTRAFQLRGRASERERLEITAEARAQKLESARFHGMLYVLAFLQGDAGAMAEQQDWFASEPADESDGSAGARRSAAEALQLAPTSKRVQSEAALAFALAGNPARARLLAGHSPRQRPRVAQIARRCCQVRPAPSTRQL